MEYVQLTMEDYIQSKKEIKKDLGRIVKSFVRIGWQLTRINNSEAYKMDGYKTIAEFAKAEYGMNPSGVTRFMQVYEKYSVPGDTPELQDKYKDFNFSQLTEMLQLTEEERGMFQPESKREDIREYKNFKKENENNPDNLLNWRKEPEDLIGKTVLEFFRNNKELLNDLYGSEACTSGNLKDMVEIINPSGNRHYRHKTIFLMMYDCDKGLMVSEFGKIQESMTWKRFFEITKGIFEEAAAGSRTWENYFEPQKTADQEPTEEPEIAPAQKEPEKQEEPQEGQIPGQDSILNHPELMPEPQKTEIAPAQTEFEPIPESITSLCYSCQHYSECNAKSGTAKECNEYINKAEAEKTDEQKYSEEQAKLDRETKRKLQEKAQEEKMSHLPSEAGQQVHQIRLATNYFDDVAAGIKTFELRKNDRHYKRGDILEMMEFAEGRNTGRMIRAEVTYILEDYTGLEDGYCILAIKVIETEN